MDDELKLHLEAMEGRLMGRITGLQEQMLERFRSVDQRLDAISATLTELQRTITAAICSATVRTGSNGRPSSGSLPRGKIGQ